MNDEAYKFFYIIVFGIFLGAAIELLLGSIFDYYLVFGVIVVIMVLLQVYNLGSGKWQLE